jgi:hypothetical protein
MNTNQNSVTVTGNTYPAAKLLRDCGFNFDKASKSWVGDASALAELRRVSTATYSRANGKLVAGLKIAE